MYKIRGIKVIKVEVQNKYHDVIGYCISYTMEQSAMERRYQLHDENLCFALKICYKSILLTDYNGEAIVAQCNIILSRKRQML